MPSSLHWRLGVDRPLLFVWFFLRFHVVRVWQWLRMYALVAWEASNQLVWILRNSVRAMRTYRIWSRHTGIVRNVSYAVLSDHMRHQHMQRFDMGQEDDDDGEAEGDNSSKPASSTSHSPGFAPSPSYDAPRWVSDEDHMNTQKLDIYVPMQAQQWMENPRAGKHPRLPVLVFVQGGAWKNGNKWLYAELGLGVRRRHMLFVVPQFCMHPARIHEILHDVNAAIQWTFENIHLYGGDPNNVFLVGHSSGSHLVSTLLTHKLAAERHRAQRKEMLVERTELRAQYEKHVAQLKKHASLPHPYQVAHHTAKLEELEAAWEALMERQDVVRDSDVHRTGSRLLALSHCQQQWWRVGQIAGFVGMCGPYHLLEHREHEAWRGLAEISPMTETMHGLEEFGVWSPTTVLRILATDASSASNERQLPPTLLLHGAGDGTVPLASSARYARAVQQVGSWVMCIRYENLDHTHIWMDLGRALRKHKDEHTRSLRRAVLGGFVWELEDGDAEGAVERLARDVMRFLEVRTQLHI